MSEHKLHIISLKTYIAVFVSLIFFTVVTVISAEFDLGSFNIIDMDHGLVAAILNDHFNIAVRNECFCAHPYVEKMLHMTHKEKINQLDCLDDHLAWKVEPWMGMVRASIGLYNTKNDIDFLIMTNLEAKLLEFDNYSFSDTTVS